MIRFDRNLALSQAYLASAMVSLPALESLEKGVPLLHPEEPAKGEGLFYGRRFHRLVSEFSDGGKEDEHKSIRQLALKVFTLASCLGFSVFPSLNTVVRHTPTTVVLVVSACLLVALALISVALAHDYFRITRKQTVKVDDYLGPPTFLERAWVALITRMNGADVPSSEGDAVMLSASPSPHVEDLVVVQSRSSSFSTTDLDSTPAVWPPGASALDMSPRPSPGSSVVISTIRMGFGHYRLAYSACSWLRGSGLQTYFHDLLSIDSKERQLLLDNDEAYRAASKAVSEIGGPIEKVWGVLTTSQQNCRLQLRNFVNFAHVMRPLMEDIPKDVPVICTHCMAGLTAVACGFTKVINLVVDNHAKWDVIVPGAINLVQGPKMYMDLLQIGVPKENLRYAGHWIPKEIVENLEGDCEARIQRSARKAPLRLLVPIGGAGAQKRFVTSFIQELREALADGQVELVLNAGDHRDIHTAFKAVLQTMPEVTTQTLSTGSVLSRFCEHLCGGGKPEAQVTLLAFDQYFSAVTATDRLTRCCDVLVCKPSELAFYPIPKLHIRRVGDHEEASAVRAAELGDGTLEARDVKEALAAVRLLQRPELLEHMNRCIVRNGQAGVYSGCEVAAQLARSL